MSYQQLIDAIKSADREWKNFPWQDCYYGGYTINRHNKHLPEAAEAYWSIVDAVEALTKALSDIAIDMLKHDKIEDATQTLYEICKIEKRAGSVNDDGEARVYTPLYEEALRLEQEFLSTAKKSRASFVYPGEFRAAILRRAEEMVLAHAAS